MGSKKNLVLASFVSLVMVLSFVIGLVPMIDDTGRDATAAPGAASVAISVDGATPVGSTFAIPVGGEQGFSALSLAGGSVSRLLATGEVEWSLASDGAAILTSQPGDMVATVAALAPGQAALYVSTPDGLVDVVNLTFTQLKPKALGKALSDLTIISPKNYGVVYVESGKTGIPYVLLSETDDDTDVSGGVQYAWDAALEIYSDPATDPPYAVTIPDITDPAVADVIGARVASLSASGEYYYDTAMYMLLDITADGDGNGIPDNPFSFALGSWDNYRNSSDVSGLDRQVAMTGLLEPLKGIAFGSEGVSVGLADPNDPSRVVTVTVPEGVVEPSGFARLLVAVSDTAEGLLGETEAAELDTEPEGGITEGGMYVFVAILVSDDGETYTSLTELDPSTPITVKIAGVGVLANENVTLYSHAATVADNGEGDADIDVDTEGVWTAASGGTQVETGVVSASLTTLGVVAPFATAGLPNIVGVVNVDTGLASAYAIGGETVRIDVENVSTDDTDIAVLIDGMPALVTNSFAAAGQIYAIYVTVPEAQPVDPPVASLAVPVTLTGTSLEGEYSDTLPEGLTYLAPSVTSVSPTSGTENDLITVTGEGFVPGIVASLGGVNVTPSLAGDNASFSFLAPANPVGPADLVVGYTNGYETVVDDAFTYVEIGLNIIITPEESQAIAGLEGGPFSPESIDFTVGAEGTGSLTWTVSVDVPWLDLSIPGSTEPGVVTATVNDAATLLAPGEYTATLTFDSNAGSLTRTVVLTVSAIEGPVQITSVTPSSGSTAGGNQVTIVGTGFGGTGLDLGPTIETGTVLRLADVEVDEGAAQAVVQLSLFRGPEQDFSRGPAALNAVITYDTSKLQFVSGARPALLRDWYDKQVQISEETPGEIRFVIAAINQYEITTFDDQIPSNPAEEEFHDPSAQTNPFPLANLTFNIVSLNPNEVATLALSDITMASREAAPLGPSFGVAGQDGAVYISGEALPPVVQFGANTATVVSSTDTEIVAVVPAGEEGFVNVRVTNPNLPEPNNYDILPSGYQYILPGGDLSISGISPNRFWLFGGVVATITGTGFDETTQIYFGDASGGVPAPLPAPAEVVSIAEDGSSIQVVVPPLPNPAAVAGVAEVVTDVRAVKGENPIEANDAVTYVHFEMNGDISTTAFYFDTANGTADDAGIIALDGEQTAELVVPGFSTDDIKLNTGTLDARTFVLARASRDEFQFGLDEADLPGVPLLNGWAFDVHMYDGTYPFTGELNISFNTESQEVVTNTAALAARLTFPVEGLSLADVQGGRASVFSLDTDLDYAANLAGGGENSGFLVDPANPNAKSYQSNISPTEYTVVGDQVTSVTARLYHLTAYSLRTGFDPADIAQPVLDIPNPAHREANTNENKDIIITGQNLSWATAVYFGVGPINSRDDLSDTTRFAQGQILDKSDFQLRVRTPRAPEGVNGANIDVYVVFPAPQLPTKAPVPGVAVLENIFEWKAVGGIPRRLLLLLLGLLAALIGLFAGGDGGGGGGPCFIATAAYGTPMADQIDTLRVFRDTFLLSNPVGTAFADLYYHVSPAIADVVAKSPVLAAAVRVALLPVIFVAKLFVAMPGVGVTLSSIAFGLMALRYRVRRGRKA